MRNVPPAIRCRSQKCDTKTPFTGVAFFVGTGLALKKMQYPSSLAIRPRGASRACACGAQSMKMANGKRAGARTRRTALERWYTGDHFSLIVSGLRGLAGALSELCELEADCPVGTNVPETVSILERYKYKRDRTAGWIIGPV